MRLVTDINPEKSTAALDLGKIDEISTVSRHNQTFHDISDYSDINENDVVERLRANVNRLSDLSQRMNFMMGEIKGIIKA